MARLCIVALTLALLCALPPGARAREGDSANPIATPAPAPFTIALDAGDDPDAAMRGYFVYELAPKATARGTLRLQNPGDAPVTVDLAAVDAEPAQAGGSAFAASDAAPAAAATWLRLDESRITIEPGEEVSVGVAVQPPAETHPGQHLAGIAAFVPIPAMPAPIGSADEVAATVMVQTRHVIGVEIDVPGEWSPSLAIAGARWLEQPSGSALGIAIRNDGDTFLWPRGSVTLHDAEATPILSEPIDLGTVITGTAITYPIAWPGVPRAGDYRVEVELRYAQDKVARYSGSLTVPDDAPVTHAVPREPAPAPAPLATPAGAPTASPGQSWPRYLGAALLGMIALLLLFARARQPRW
jgi:hypothetical protein